MTNQARGIISLPYEGKNLQLRIATNEWCELEDEFGKGTDEIAGDFQTMVTSGKLKMGLLRSFFRAALSGTMPDVTHEQAGAIMTEIGLIEAGSVIGKVIVASMPAVDGPEAREPAGKRKAARSRP